MRAVVMAPPHAGPAADLGRRLQGASALRRLATPRSSPATRRPARTRASRLATSGSSPRACRLAQTRAGALALALAAALSGVRCGPSPLDATSAPATAAGTSASTAAAEPPPRVLVSVSVTDRTKDVEPASAAPASAAPAKAGSAGPAKGPGALPARPFEASVAPERLRAAVESGLATAGLSVHEGATLGFRAEVAVIYGAVESEDGPAGAAPELHALVELRLAPAGPPAAFAALPAASALAEIGEGVTAPPAGGPTPAAYAELVEKLVSDVARSLSRHVWPAAPARDDAALRAALHDPTPATRLAALDEVASSMLRPLAADAAALLDDPDPSVSARAVGVLAELGDPSVIPALVRASRGKNGQALYRLLDAAGRIGGKQARAFLDAVSSGHPDPEARARAAAALESLLRRAPGAP